MDNLTNALSLLFLDSRHASKVVNYNHRVFVSKIDHYLVEPTSLSLGIHLIVQSYINSHFSILIGGRNYEMMLALLPR